MFLAGKRFPLDVFRCIAEFVLPPSQPYIPLLRPLLTMHNGAHFWPLYLQADADHWVPRLLAMENGDLRRMAKRIRMEHEIVQLAGPRALAALLVASRPDI